jgi:gamma-glutamyltranspeptidase/glutathione hydrolase
MRTTYRNARRLSSITSRYLPFLLAASALGLAAMLPAAPVSAAFPPSAEGGHVAVATDNADATQAAIEVLSAGGNAADAAITAALVLGVTSPSASGLGGGGFALVYSAKDKKVSAIDFRETAPKSVNAQALLTREGRPLGAPIGIPGEPAGLALLSERFGKKSLSDVAAPAALIASRGFHVGLHLHHTTAAMPGRVARSSALAQVLLPGGAPVPFGSVVKRPDLARTITRFGREGRKGFYEGEVAAKIVQAFKGAGADLDPAELAAYKPKERTPLSRTIDGRTVYTMPAPSAGGMMLLETLLMHGASSSSMLTTFGPQSSAYLHVVAETMRGAVADRARLLGDPDLDRGIDASVDAALLPAQIAARKARIEMGRAHTAPEFKTNEGGTSHLVVADAEGNIVSLTTTVNGPFGAGVVAGDTGVLLNDELDDFSRPDDVAPFGVTAGGPNRPRPGARPVSSMTPTIVIENGEPIMALGGSGGTRIATGVTQVALCRLLFQADPVQCVSQPRVHVTKGQELSVEHDVPEDVRSGLVARGEQPKEELNYSAVQLVAFERKAGVRKVLAASDPRKQGFAAAK